MISESPALPGGLGCNEACQSPLGVTVLDSNAVPATIPSWTDLRQNASNDPPSFVSSQNFRQNARTISYAGRFGWPAKIVSTSRAERPAYSGAISGCRIVAV